MSKAAATLFHSTGQPIEFREVPLPDLPNETLIRVKCCTLCGSDLHTYLGRRSVAVPTILGHEIIGEITRLPDNARCVDALGKPLAVGDRVVWAGP